MFFLSRVREEWDRTGNNATAVATASPERLIAAAAAIITICVFGGFVLSAERSLQISGLGLAVAVFIDATIVRSSSSPPPWNSLATATGGSPSSSIGDSRASTSKEPTPPRRPALLREAGDCGTSGSIGVTCDIRYVDVAVRYDYVSLCRLSIGGPP